MIYALIFNILLYVALIFLFIKRKNDALLKNVGAIVICALTWLLNVSQFLQSIVFYLNGRHDLYTLTTRFPLGSISNLCFFLCPLCFIQPKRNWLTNLIVQLIVPMLCVSVFICVRWFDGDIIGGKDCLQCTASILCHLFISLFGWWLAINDKISHSYKSVFTSYAVVVILQLVAFVINCIYDTVILGLSLTKYEPIYFVIDTGNVPLNVLLFNVAVFAILSVGFLLSRFVAKKCNETKRVVLDGTQRTEK